MSVDSQRTIEVAIRTCVKYLRVPPKRRECSSAAVLTHESDGFLSDHVSVDGRLRRWMKGLQNATMIHGNNAHNNGPMSMLD